MWRENCQIIYDTYKIVDMEWSSTSICWGYIVEESKFWKKQNLYYSCKTEGSFNLSQNRWEGLPNSLIQVSTELAKVGIFLLLLYNIYIYLLITFLIFYKGSLHITNEYVSFISRRNFCLIF